MVSWMDNLRHHKAWSNGGFRMCRYLVFILWTEKILTVNRWVSDLYSVQVEVATLNWMYRCLTSACWWQKLFIQSAQYTTALTDFWGHLTHLTSWLDAVPSDWANAVCNDSSGSRGRFLFSMSLLLSLKSAKNTKSLFSQEHYIFCLLHQAHQHNSIKNSSYLENL